MTDLSLDALRSASARETGLVWITLLTFTHHTLAEPLRLCDGGRDLVSRGHTYTYCPFDISFPGQHEDRPPLARIEIINVGRVLDALVTLQGKVRMTVEVVLDRWPDRVERTWSRLELLNITGDELHVAGDLGYRSSLDAAFPAYTQNPATVPGLF